MKTNNLIRYMALAIILFLQSALLTAQIPQKVSYQSIIRDATGALVKSSTVGVRISILQGTASGIVSYSETHLVVTNVNGLATLEVGMGTPVDDRMFSEIDWSKSPYFLKVETDPSGGTNYTVTGTSEILSMPYALYAQSVSPTAFMAPSTTTTLATNIQSFSAVLNGKVNGNGFMTTVSFQWGLTTEYGNEASSITVVGTEDNVVNAEIGGLESLTTYHYRIKATNAVNITYSGDMTFTTSTLLPQLTSSEPTSISSTTAIAGGNVTSEGGAIVTSRGVCWNTTGNPTIADSKTNDGTGIGTFTSLISELTSGTTYYVKAYATNSEGTAYGMEYSFKTFNGTVADIDGNIYNTVTIGTQVWMVENLKTTKYNDGISIPNVTNNFNWRDLTTPAYCWYNNDAANKTPNGALYNWYTVNTGKLAPTGWHIPTDAEWITFSDYLTNNGYGYEGSGNDIAKSIASSSGWQEYSISGSEGAVGNDQSSNNSSGFTAYPSGNRVNDSGVFAASFGCGGYWWSSTEAESHTVIFFQISSFENNISSGYTSKTYGFSVRCVKNSIPFIRFDSVTSISQTSAVGCSNVTIEGGAIVTARGICWNTTGNPTIEDSKTTDGAGLGTFISSISGLTSGTTYFVKAYATNSEGIAYSNEVSFKTMNAVLPTLSTTTISSITTISAISGGTISSDGGALVTARGVCWNTTGNPTIEDCKTTDGAGLGTFISSISGLTTNTTYNIRSFATNSTGTGYGKEYLFKTYTGTAADIDGNVYNTVTIGTQIWMVENLKTTKYNDGMNIPNVIVDVAWGILTTPAYCWYNNDVANKNTYGALYNWYTVNTGKLAPTGWHVPTDEELTTLTDYLTINGYGYEGSGDDIAKSLAATSGWNAFPFGLPPAGTPGNDPTNNNSSGFTALPGGFCIIGDGYYNIGHDGFWWSSSETSGNAWHLRILNEVPKVLILQGSKQGGFSVRCVKD